MSTPAPAYVSRLRAGDVPRTLATFQGRGVPPVLDLLDFVGDDFRIAQTGAGRTADERYGFFLALDADGTPRSLPNRTAALRHLAARLDEIADDCYAWRFKPLTRSRTEPHLQRCRAVSQALRAYRDALARMSKSTGALLVALADEAPVLDVSSREPFAASWLDDYPRERVLRSKLSEDYVAAGSPGALSRPELFDLVRRRFPRCESKSKGLDYFSLNRFGTGAGAGPQAEESAAQAPSAQPDEGAPLSVICERAS